MRKSCFPIRVLFPVLALTGAFAQNAFSQTVFSTRPLSMPGLGTSQSETKVEGNVGFRTSEQNIKFGAQSLKSSSTWMLDVNAGIKPKGEGVGRFIEFDFGASVGGTDVVNTDTFTNVEIGGSFIGKYEMQLSEGHKLVPFARLGTTFNGVSNYRETTVGYGDFYYNQYNSTLTYNRYYYSSGDVYIDLYGAASVGLSYIFADNKAGVSSEVGTWDSMVGDMKDGDLSMSGSKYFWSSQAFFKFSERVGLKASYALSSVNDLGGRSGLKSVNSTFAISLTMGF